MIWKSFYEDDIQPEIQVPPGLPWLLVGIKTERDFVKSVKYMSVLVGECSFPIFFFFCLYRLICHKQEKNTQMSLLLYYIKDNCIGQLDCLFAKEIQILSCFMKNKKRSEMCIFFLSEGHFTF